MKHIFHAAMKCMVISCYVLLCAICCIFVLSSFRSNNTTLHAYLLDEDFPAIMPDSLPQDTFAFVTGDTIEFYVSGNDTVYVLYEDTLSDSTGMLEKDYFTNTERITISLNPVSYNVQPGVLGTNITDLFESDHANEDELGIYGTDPTPWDYLSDLKPKLLRFPSGSGGKFMHLLGSQITTDEFEPLKHQYDWNGGYGFNLEEIIQYFDMTDYDEVFGIDPHSYPGYDIYDLRDLTKTDLQLEEPNNWINSQYYQNFIDFKNKFFEQTTYDPDVYTNEIDKPLAVNQLVRLVEKIETENPDQQVDVILCLNILSEPASVCKDIINYLRVDNQYYPVNVTSVELGNECYFKIHQDMMGFTDFDHYWLYINGDPYPVGDPFPLDAVLPAVMESDRDFIQTLKGEYEFDVKIGIPVANLNHCIATDDFPFVIHDPDDEDGLDELPGDCTEEVCTYPDWNTAAVSHYADIIYAGTHPRYTFNAVILHPYYNATNSPDDACNTNWKNIPWQGLNIDYATGGLHIYSDGPWEYTSIGPRLQITFDGIVGKPTDNNGDGIAETDVGNFRDFVKSRIKLAMDEHSTNLDFTSADTGPQCKEVWFTEYNFNTDNNVSSDEAPYVTSVLNTFAHAAGLQGWILWNLKANTLPAYRSGFLTVATLQNFLGGSIIDLMSAEDKTEQFYHGRTSLCDPYDDVTCSTPNPCLAPYFMPRTTYYQMELLSEITYNQLDLLKAVYTVFSLNPNLAPTVFLDDNPSDPKLYIYYTNIKDDLQTFVINPGTLYSHFPGAVSISLTPQSLTYLNALRNYATSGGSPLYNINSHYYCASGHNHPIIIDHLSGATGAITCPAGLPSGTVCTVAPGPSSGYFIIDIDVNYRLGTPTDQFAIFPNPASTYFIIQQENDGPDSPVSMQIEIYSVDGALVGAFTDTQEGEVIDISQLPAGIYTVLIKTDGLPTEAEVMIKMK